MKFIKKFDSFNDAKSTDLYSPMTIKIDESGSTSLAIGKLKGVDEDTSSRILSRFRTVEGFENNIKIDFERGFGRVRAEVYEVSFDSSILSSLEPSSEATCLFKTSTDYIGEGADPEECFVYDGEYTWNDSTYFKWKATPNSSVTPDDGNMQHEYLAENDYYILTDTRDFSNVSVDNPYTPVGYILNDNTGEGEYRQDVIVLGVNNSNIVVTKVVKYIKPDTLEHHDTSTLDANGFEYVDLGLPSGTLWATMNIGAAEETDYGHYFQWGDPGIADNKDCLWRTYKFGNADNNALTKYVNNDGQVVLDEIIELAPEDDMAHVHMGGDWKLPTKKHFEELLDNTTFEWITNYNGTGINGRKFTSKTNSNSIFIPASGYRYGGSVSNLGTSGCLWSSSLHSIGPQYVYTMNLNLESSAGVGIYDRCYGFCSRGILY